MKRKLDLKLFWKPYNISLPHFVRHFFIWFFKDFTLRNVFEFVVVSVHKEDYKSYYTHKYIISRYMGYFCISVYYHSSPPGSFLDPKLGLLLLLGRKNICIFYPTQKHFCVFLLKFTPSTNRFFSHYWLKFCMHTVLFCYLTKYFLRGKALTNP